MFTGLIEELGVIRAVRPQGTGLRLTVEARKVLDDVKIDDSVSINGACQTVVALTNTTFDVDTVRETLEKTTLVSFGVGKRVNLERAMQLGARLGGHLVQGHVDTRGTVVSVESQQGSWLLTVRFPEEFTRYVIPVGSICIDGVSLTAARVQANTLTVAVIPHTWKSTTLAELTAGAAVNLEFDLIGKYVERMLASGIDPHSTPQTNNHNAKPSQLNEAWLASMGY
jgi:riboflavin synthase